MSIDGSKSVAQPKRKAYGLIFGVEKYADSGLDPVIYAERDATEIAKALIAVGYTTADVTVILNEKATKTTIEYEITELAHRATKDDSLFIFFAGHGYTYGGENFLVAHDSRRGNIPKTAVSLREMFEACTGSLSRQVMFFLDCCHSGMKVADEGRDVLEMMSHEELKSYFAKAEFCAVFSSCDKGEKSYPSHDYKHGYWTYHLLRALRGEEPDVLDKAGHLRSIHLQDYVRSEVPKQVALKSSGVRSQNPKMYGDISGTFVIADLTPVLAQAEADRKLTTLALKHTTLRGSDSGSQKQLGGWIKGHHLPDYYSANTKKWLAHYAEVDSKKEIDEYFRIVRKTGFYRNESLKYDPPAEGGAGIRTPDFEFSIYYSQDEDDPGGYEVTRELIRLNKPTLLEEDWFNRLFADVFDEAIFTFSGKIDVNSFINKAESVDQFRLDFDGDRRKCTIKMDGFNGAITLTQDALIYKFYGASTPGEMALALQEAHALFLTVPGMQKALPL